MWKEDVKFFLRNKYRLEQKECTKRYTSLSRQIDSNIKENDPTAHDRNRRIKEKGGKEWLGKIYDYEVPFPDKTYAISEKPAGAFWDTISSLWLAY